MLYESPVKRHAVGTEVVAKHWGFKVKSSSFKLNLAAVRYYGFMDLEDGGGEKLYKLSPLALDTVDYPEGSKEYQAALKKAALNPKLFRALWIRWGETPPPDEEIRRYLLRERGFNDKTVDAVIADYRATISLAKLTANDKIGEEADTEDDAPPRIAIGDLVQWTCNGADMFSEPRPVRLLSE